MSLVRLLCGALSLWEQEDAVGHSAAALQLHPVLVHRHGGEGVVVGRRLDHALQRQVVHARVPVLVVAAVVVVSGHETHHAAVAADQSEQLIEVPGQADGAGGQGVDRQVTCGQEVTGQH